MVRKTGCYSICPSPVCPRVAYSPGAAPFPVLYRLFSWVTPVPPGFPFGSFRIPFVAFGVFSGSFPRFSGFRDLRAPSTLTLTNRAPSTLTFTNRAPFDPHSHKPFPGWRPPGGLIRTAASGAVFFGRRRSPEWRGYCRSFPARRRAPRSETAFPMASMQSTMMERVWFGASGNISRVATWMAKAAMSRKSETMRITFRVPWCRVCF